jgi:hypothetical protein
LYQPDPVTVPCAVVAVKKYWVVQVAIAVSGPFIMMALEVNPVPEAAPDQLKKTY